MRYGIIGLREHIDPLLAGAVTRSGSGRQDWVWCERKTGRPHGESYTVCADIALRWLRGNARNCRFVVYLLPPCGVGATLYRDSVESDRDFVPGHRNVSERSRVHNKYEGGLGEKYARYVSYLLREFPNLYLLPVESYMGHGDPGYGHAELMRDFPGRVVDPALLGSMEGGLGPGHRSALLSALGLEWPSRGNLRPMDGGEDVLQVGCYTPDFWPWAIDQAVSLRMLGGYHGRIAHLVYGDLGQRQTDALDRLGVEVCPKGPPPGKMMVQRFLDIRPLLRQCPPESPVLFMDTDAWVQSSMADIFPVIRERCAFGSWHGQELFVKKMPGLQDKYVRVLAAYSEPDPRTGSPAPVGGMPHGGLHGGPAGRILDKYEAMSRHLEAGDISLDRTMDEVSLLMSFEVGEDDFSMNRFWTSVPATVDFSSRIISDPLGNEPPIIHFERGLSHARLANFGVLYPDVLALAGEKFGTI